MAFSLRVEGSRLGIPSPVPSSHGRHANRVVKPLLASGEVQVKYPVAAAIAAALLLFVTQFGVAFADPGPTFQPGFQQLASAIPSVVGQPLEQGRYDPVNGNALQLTSNGLLVWRKGDSWTAFTDGATTWVLGPTGVESRPNDQRFSWEEDGGPVVAAAPPPAPPAIPGVFAPTVKAMDSQSGVAMASVKALMKDVDQEWVRVWGWRPSRPTTVYMYFDGDRMADGFSAISGQPLTLVQRDGLSKGAAGIMTVDSSTGGWAVLVNLGDHYGSSQWDDYMKAVLVHEYTHVMQMDVAGEAGPDWFREGMAELNAYVRAPGAVAYFGRPSFVSWYRELGRLPTLRHLQDSWQKMEPTREMAQVAYGMSYLAVEYLSEKVGGMPLLEVLRKTAGGESFESALQEVTGYTLDRLDREYRVRIPARPAWE